MFHYARPALFLVLLFSLSACGTDRDSSSARYGDGPLLPLPHNLTWQDPSDLQLQAAITAFIGEKRGPTHTKYTFIRTDLNGDQKRDALVMLNAPTFHWCNEHGCTLAVFEAEPEGFTPRGAIFPVRGPLTISPYETGGWKDLIIRLSGRMNDKTRDVRVSYDPRKQRYEDDPEDAPEITNLPLKGIRVFY